MQTYHPDTAPDPAQWLALSDTQRMALVLQHHHEGHIHMPHPRLHVAVHVIVETQAAQGVTPVTGALARLQAEGLSRHDAVHAVASVAARRVQEALKSGEPDADSTFGPEYAAALDALDAATWQRLNAEVVEKEARANSEGREGA
jgi:hypothetical protein